MTTGPARTGRRRHDREIARLAIPAFGALIAEPLYVLADTAVVGHVGTDQLAGLAVASSALLTGYAAFIFLAYGTTAAVSRLLGAGRDGEAAHQAVQGLWLAAVIGLAVTVVVGGAAVPIVSLLGAAGAVRTNAVVYLRISALGTTFQLLTFAGTGYLRGLQDTRTPLLVAVGTAVGNLVLELVLINGLGYGIGASALSTVLAQAVGAIVYVRLITRATSRLGAALRPDWSAIRRLGRVGGDLLLRTLALRGSLTLFTAVAARVGTVDVGRARGGVRGVEPARPGARCHRHRRPVDDRPVPRSGRHRDGPAGRDGACSSSGTAAGAGLGVLVLVTRPCSPRCSATTPRWSRWPASCCCSSPLSNR